MTTEAVETPPEVAEAPNEPQDTPQAPQTPDPEPEEKKEPKVLDLTALAPNRRLVKLPTAEHPKGETFEIRLLDDFGIATQQKLLNWSRTYERLFNSEEDLSDDEQVRLKFVLDSLFDAVLDAPVAVKREMSDAVRSRVMTTFSLAPLIAQQEQRQAEIEEAEKKEAAEEAAKEKAAEKSTSES